MGGVGFLRELLSRAWQYTVSAMGTATLAFVSVFVVLICLFFCEWALDREGFRAAATKRRADLLLAFVTVLIWALIFGWKLVFSVPRDIRSMASVQPLPALPTKIKLPLFAYEKTKHDPVWGYAFFIHKYPLGMEQKLHLAVTPGAPGNLHNVEISVWELDPPDLGSGQANRQRDLDMFNTLGTILPVVRAGTFVDTGLLYDYRLPWGKFEITMRPENGDEVKEEIGFAVEFQCIHKVTRTRDKKILMEHFTPPFDMWGHPIKTPLSSCQGP